MELWTIPIRKIPNESGILRKTQNLNFLDEL